MHLQYSHISKGSFIIPLSDAERRICDDFKRRMLRTIVHNLSLSIRLVAELVVKYLTCLSVDYDFLVEKQTFQRMSVKFATNRQGLNLFKNAAKRLSQ